MGKSVLLPIEAYGYIGSTIYYTELKKDCDKEILNFVDMCHKYDIPINNYHLSSGYSE